MLFPSSHVHLSALLRPRVICTVGILRPLLARTSFSNSPISPAFSRWVGFSPGRSDWHERSESTRRGLESSVPGSISSLTLAQCSEHGQIATQSLRGLYIAYCQRHQHVGDMVLDDFR
jgi:hypothetical protein